MEAILNSPTAVQDLSLDELETVNGGVPAIVVVGAVAAGGLVGGVVVGLVILAAVDYLY